MLTKVLGPRPIWLVASFYPWGLGLLGRLRPVSPPVRNCSLIVILCPLPCSARPYPLAAVQDQGALGMWASGASGWALRVVWAQAWALEKPRVQGPRTVTQEYLLI